MTQRKPASLTFESWVDKQIREATERGEFDDLPGAGNPLPTGPADEMWWIKQKLHREGLSTEALLPASMRLRKEIERLPETVRELTTEQAVRDLAQELNQRVAEALRAPSDGLRVPIRPVNVAEIVRHWHEDRRAPAQAPAEATRPPTEGTRHGWIRWCRRLFRR